MYILQSKPDVDININGGVLKQFKSGVRVIVCSRMKTSWVQLIPQSQKENLQVYEGHWNNKYEYSSGNTLYSVSTKMGSNYEMNIEPRDHTLVSFPT